MRRLKRLIVSREIQAALAEHLGAEFHHEKQAARESRAMCRVVLLVVLAAVAALLFALLRH
jgi:hypothetical protein